MDTQLVVLGGGPGGYAAAFLAAAVDETIPWAHVDLAGPVWAANWTDWNVRREAWRGGLPLKACGSDAAALIACQPRPRTGSSEKTSSPTSMTCDRCFGERNNRRA